MLQQLSISNYALIDKTDIDFASGMSVITGETGAGKSIMLGALGLILGQRADVQVLLDKEKKCVVEASFDISAYALEQLFADNDVEYDANTIIRREILPNGKSRAFVNDTPVNLTFLKDVAQRLIDIHSQHQNLLLNDDAFHLNVVDAVASTADMLAQYKALYKQYRQMVAQEQQLVADNDKMKQDYDYLLFQHNQLAEAKLADGEEVALEQERERLVHAEEIKAELGFAVEALGADGAALSQLAAVAQRLGKIESFLPADAAAVERIESARVDLSDLLKSLERLSEGVEFDPLRIQEVEQRLDLIYSLEQKHKVRSVAELIDIQRDMEAKLGNISSFDENIEELRKAIAAKRSELAKVSGGLTSARKAVFGKVTDYITSLLRDMGMANAQFVVSHSPVPDFTPTGSDAVRFLFAANKNGEPTDISKVASGGEMSRVMLSIKSLLSKSKELPTIIFDEIDTGVSGDVADRMGRIMTDMSASMQVIAITHLPQVAAKGACHYRVFKVDTADRTVSNIQKLSSEARVEEIAKMLSGSKITDAALQNAQELLRM